MIPEKLITLLDNFRPAFPKRLWKMKLCGIAVFSLLVPLSVYMGARIPPIPFLYAMAVQPKAKTQSVAPMDSQGQPLIPGGVTYRPPVAGTFAQGVSAYPFSLPPKGEEPLSEEAAEALKKRAGLALRNPLSATMINLRRGERIFDNYCQPCHGYKGLADGSVVGLGRLAAPSTLHSDKVKAYLDGEIFHIITVGQKNMPSYAWQISEADRWAAVHYVRVLHRALAPKPEDLAESNGKKARATTGPQAKEVP